MNWRVSPEGQHFAKNQAEIAHLQAQAKKDGSKGALDPMSFFIAKEQYKENEDRKKKEEELTTPYGVARTADDAKKLKDAGDRKDQFDRMLTEMIELRQKHGGGASLNREDVQRGQQLSKDLLLAYKDLANLGVLSKSDENILNTIIPADPLEYNILAGAVGQDPTMHRMKKFKSDVEADFQHKVANRIRGGAVAQSQNPGVQKQDGSGFGPTSANAGSIAPPPEGMIAMQAPNGKIKYIPASQKGEAIAAGGKVLK